MKKNIYMLYALLACIGVASGQAYYEASGQTVVFTLTAGAKVGPSAIRKGSEVSAGIKSGLNVVMTRSGIVITLPNAQHRNADIALYNIAGRKIYQQFGISGTLLRLETQTFAPGIYSLLVRVDGKNYSHRIVVNR